MAIKFLVYLNTLRTTSGRSMSAHLLLPLKSSKSYLNLLQRKRGSIRLAWLSLSENSISFRAQTKLSCFSWLWQSPESGSQAGVLKMRLRHLLSSQSSSSVGSAALQPPWLLRMNEQGHLMPSRPWYSRSCFWKPMLGKTQERLLLTNSKAASKVIEYLRMRQEMSMAELLLMPAAQWTSMLVSLRCCSMNSKHSSKCWEMACESESSRSNLMILKLGERPSCRLTAETMAPIPLFLSSASFLAKSIPLIQMPPLPSTGSTTHCPLLQPEPMNISILQMHGWQQQFMQKYRVVKSLGEGAYGTVLKAQVIETGEFVAIKKIKEKKADWDQCVNLREIKSLSKLKHPNIIKLREVIRAQDQLHLVFEYLETNIYQLYSALKEKKKQLDEPTIRSIVGQVASGLAYMHKNGYFHRDLKPENILITGGLVKIIDFGLARQIRSRPPYTEYVSTRWYRAPELILRADNYNSPVDIFALGCIMAQLYLNGPLFPGNQSDQLVKVMKILGTPRKDEWPEGFKLASKSGVLFPEYPRQELAKVIPKASPEAINLIQLMLQYPARKRPTAFDLLKHPYFQGFNPEVGLKVPQEIVVMKQSERQQRKQMRESQMRETRKQKFLQSKRAEETWLKKTGNLDNQRKPWQKPVQQKYEPEKKPWQKQKGERKEEDVDDIIKQITRKKKEKESQLSQKLPTESYSKPKFQAPKQQIKEYREFKPTSKEHYNAVSTQPRQPKAAELAKAKLNFAFSPFQPKVQIPKPVLNFPKYQIKRNFGLADRVSGSLQRPLGLGGVGMNIMKPISKERDLQLPSVMGYKFGSKF